LVLLVLVAVIAVIPRAGRSWEADGEFR
jgi:hypothetical protein